MLRAFTVRAAVVKTRSPPSTTNQIGTTCGRPSLLVVASFPVRVPWARNARHSSSVMVLPMAANVYRGASARQGPPLRSPEHAFFEPDRPGRAQQVGLLRGHEHRGPLSAAPTDQLPCALDAGRVEGPARVFAPPQ